MTFIFSIKNSKSFNSIQYIFIQLIVTLKVKTSTIVKESQAGVIEYFTIQNIPIR
jgi:hypothetical protein